MQRSMQNSDKEVSGLSSEDLLWDKLSNNIRKRILNLTFRALVYCLPEHFSALTSKGAPAKNLSLARYAPVSLNIRSQWHHRGAYLL